MRRVASVRAVFVMRGFYRGGSEEVSAGRPATLGAFPGEGLVLPFRRPLAVILRVPRVESRIFFFHAGTGLLRVRDEQPFADVLHGRDQSLIESLNQQWENCKVSSMPDSGPV